MELLRIISDLQGTLEGLLGLFWNYHELRRHYLELTRIFKEVFRIIVHLEPRGIIKALPGPGTTTQVLGINIFLPIS